MLRKKLEKNIGVLTTLWNWALFCSYLADAPIYKNEDPMETEAITCGRSHPSHLTYINENYSRRVWIDLQSACKTAPVLHPADYSNVI